MDSARPDDALPRTAPSAGSRPGARARPPRESHRARFALYVALWHGVPIALLASGAVPLEAREALGLTVFAAHAARALARRFSLADLGLSARGLPDALSASGVATLFFLFVLFKIWWAEWGGASTDAPGALLFYALVWVPTQELVFRGALFAEARAAGIHSASAPALTSAALYCLWLAPLGAEYVFVGAVFGSVWGGLYARYPNLWGPIASHALVGLVALSIGAY